VTVPLAARAGFGRAPRQPSWFSGMTGAGFGGCVVALVEREEGRLRFVAATEKAGEDETPARDLRLPSQRRG